MSKQPNKTAIGAFVVGAIALTIGALIIFGSGKFFEDKRTFIMFFDGSVQGLNLGSPVNFKGVQVGAVTDIRMQFDAQNLGIRIPVLVDLSPSKIEIVGGKRDPKNMERLIQKGLRAQLKTQSLITGQLMIELNFYPDKPPRLLGDGKIEEIPTIASPLEELSKTLASIPFAEIMQKLTSAVAGIEKLISSPELSSSLRSLDGTLKDMQSLIRNVDRNLDPLTKNVNTAVQEYGALAKNINEEIDKLSEAIDITLKTAQGTSAKAEKVLINAANITSEGSPLMHELTKTLRELSDAAHSLQSVADYLERHPESLIYGKAGAQ